MTTKTERKKQTMPLIIVDDAPKELEICSNEPPPMGCILCQRPMSEKRACLYGKLGEANANLSDNELISLLMGGLESVIEQLIRMRDSQ
jgi:hypothetical protein